MSAELGLSGCSLAMQEAETWFLLLLKSDWSLVFDPHSRVIKESARVFRTTLLLLRTRLELVESDKGNLLDLLHGRIVSWILYAVG